MPSLLPEDMHTVMRRLPQDIRELIKAHRLMVGGGFIREVVAGYPPHDIDLMGPTKDTLKLASLELYTKRGQKARTLNTKNAITHVESPRTTVQFITRWLFDDPEELIRSFDFTVCQAVVYWRPGEGNELGQWCSVVSDRFYADLASRRLVYTAPDRAEDAGGSMLRMRKFLGRGYHISAEDMAKVVARLMQGVTQSRMLDHEGGLAQVIGGLLREVDPLYIIDGVQPIDIEHDEEDGNDDLPID